MKLCCLLLEIFVVSLILSLLQTPVADWLATGLNLCNSRPFNPLLRPYASASGPLFGAPASVQARGFAPCRADARARISCGSLFGAPIGFGPSEGWPTTSKPVPRGTTR